VLNFGFDIYQPLLTQNHPRMKKITMFMATLLFLSMGLSSFAQTAAERMQFLKEFQEAVRTKMEIIKSDPALYQEAIANGWFQQVEAGLKNAQDFAADNGNSGESLLLPSTNGTCETSDPFCTSGGSTYPAGVNTGTAQSGPDYGCLGDQPNPAWYYMKILTGGDIHITETNSANVDIDFILWGPFSSQNSCGSLTAGKIIDCSFSGAPVEYIDINSCSTGEYYILLVTNYSNSPTNITLMQTSGSGSTDCSIIDPPPPAPVAGPASSITATSFVANWSSAATATGYFLDVATDPGFSNFVTGFNNKNVGNVTSFSVSPLSPGTTYYYRIRAVNGGGTSPSSNTIQVVSIPPAPAAGTASTVTATSFVANWASSASATGYYLDVALDAGFTNFVTGFNNKNVGNVTSYTVTPLLPGTTYYYRIRAFNASGTSSNSNTVMVTTAATISGNTAGCAGTTTNVYTTQSGMTNYNWVLSSGGTITVGSGTNSITVTWTTAGAKTVTITYTNTTSNTASGSFALTVHPAPVPTLSGNTSTCTGVTYTYATQSGMTNYVWGVSAGGVITAGGSSSSNTITIRWDVAGAQNVSVNYNNANGCAALNPTVYNVTVNPTPVPAINAFNTPCEDNTPVDYYTQTGMFSYVWSVTAGGTILNGQGTENIQVAWNVPGPGEVSVTYTSPSGCPALAPGTYPVFVNSLPSAGGTITGTSAVCAGATGVVYSVAEISFALSYVWVMPSGATIVSGAGTRIITVDFSSTATSGNIAVAGSNQCGNGPFSPNFPVTVTGMPANAGAVSGPDEVCNSSSGNVYSVLAIENATGYNWTVPGGATITSGANSNTITVSYSATATSGNITVFGSNSCGNGALSPEYPVTVFPTPETPVITVSGDTLYSSSPTGNQWYYSQTQGGVGIPLPGATEQTYYATMTGWYWCVVTLNNCSSANSNQINVLMVGQQEIFTDNIQVYPVPNNGQFVLSGFFSGLQKFDVLIYNKTGQLIYEERGIHANGPVEKHFDLRPITSGLYFMIIRNEDGVVIKKILIHS
jgi:hypothetical protein